jgi:hypothetical protein
MKKPIKPKRINICDFCGHFWTPSMHMPDSCSICGSGSCIEMGSKQDFRRTKKFKKAWEKHENEIRERLV